LSIPLTDFPIGSYGKRSKIHARLGGQQQGGISTPSGKPYIIIFSSPRGEEFGYEDGGKGQVGDISNRRDEKRLKGDSDDGHRDM
jgi:5-methylcytosine-specific restriction protein A